MSEVTLTEENFKQEVLEFKGVVLVDFWAEWCAPCKAIAPVIKEISDEFAGKVKVCKLNVDENPNIPSKFDVVSIPTLILFKDGKVIDRLLGYQQKSAIVAKLNQIE